MNQEIVIKARGLKKVYKNVTAVSNLDLDIRRGSVLGFLGPNGAGKTTTIRMLLGLIQPTAGSAEILGYDIVRNKAQIAGKVGAIVETPMFYSYLSAEENLRVFAYSSNLAIDKKRMAKLIEMVGLKGRERELVKTYSLGMRQRLGIAATLLSNPEILFLDEPTNGLDPAGTVEMRHLITQLGSQGYTIFLSSHMLNEVEQMCTDIIIVQKGEKKLQSKIGNLLGQSQAVAIQATPLNLAREIIERHCQLVTHIEDKEWLVIKAEKAEVPAILRILIENSIEIYQVQERRNTLEKLFLELTGQPTTAAPSMAEQQLEVATL
jgi:ABC-2 type transport system ATP-binding protein